MLLAACAGCNAIATNPTRCVPVTASPHSTFDTNDEGWRATGSVFAEATPPVFNSAIRAISATGDGGWMWRAPAKFSGCFSRAYGNGLSFRLALSEGTAFCGLTAPYVRLEGRHTAVIFELEFEFPSRASDTIDALYSLRLQESEQWFNETTGMRATRVEILGILDDLVKLEISGDIGICDAVSTLDDVLLEVIP